MDPHGTLALALVLLALSPAIGQAKEEDKEVWRALDVFQHEASLRKEIAELRTELEWLHLNSVKNWTEVDALTRFIPLQREVAALRKEVAWQRREVALSQGPDSRVAVDPRLGRPPGADHGRALILTMCAGTVYFDAYCGPFLMSFERAYGAAAAEHQVVVFTSSIEEPMLEAARSRFTPWAHFEPLPRGGLTGEEEENFNSSITGNSDVMVCEFAEGGKLNCQVTPEGVENRSAKVVRNNFWFPIHIADYLQTNGKGFCHAVVMDSDTLFVRPLGRYLRDCRPGDEGGTTDEDAWDVGVTVYDPLFEVPWASEPSEAGRTQRGFARLNAGVLLLRLRAGGPVDFFLRRWAEATAWLHGGGEEAFGRAWAGADREMWAEWRDELLEEFRGPNQASLALLFSSWRPERLHTLLGWGERCEACLRAVPARLDLLEGEEPTLVRFRALPARELNHPESMPAGAFAEELLVVHLKGLWWRKMLPQGGTFFMDHHRKSSWNRDALLLHWALYEAWHYALPPEARPRAPFLMKDSEGRRVSEEELHEALKEWSAEARQEE